MINRQTKSTIHFFSIQQPLVHHSTTEYSLPSSTPHINNRLLPNNLIWTWIAQSAKASYNLANQTRDHIAFHHNDRAIALVCNCDKISTRVEIEASGNLAA